MLDIIKFLSYIKIFMNKTHILTEISSDIDDVGGYYKFWVNRAVVVRLFFMRNDLMRIKVDFENVG